MKKMKFVVIAFLMAISITAAFAFSSPTETKVTKATYDIAWFEYDPQFEDGTENPLNYHKLDGEPECSGNGDLCAIQSNVMPGDLPDVDVIYDTREKP